MKLACQMDPAVSHSARWSARTTKYLYGISLNDRPLHRFPGSFELWQSLGPHDVYYHLQ